MVDTQSLTLVGQREKYLIRYLYPYYLENDIQRAKLLGLPRVLVTSTVVSLASHHNSVF